MQCFVFLGLLSGVGNEEQENRLTADLSESQWTSQIRLIFLEVASCGFNVKKHRARPGPFTCECIVLLHLVLLWSASQRASFACFGLLVAAAHLFACGLLSTST